MFLSTFCTHQFNNFISSSLHTIKTHTHTHIYIYIYIYGVLKLEAMNMHIQGFGGET